MTKKVMESEGAAVAEETEWRRPRFFCRLRPFSQVCVCRNCASYVITLTEPNEQLTTAQIPVRFLTQKHNIDSRHFYKPFAAS